MSELVVSANDVDHAALRTAPRHGKSIFTGAVLLIAALGSCGFALLMPPLQCNDEHGHFVRAYVISRGDIIPSRPAVIPQYVLAFVQRYPEGLKKAEGHATPFRPADLLAELRGQPMAAFPDSAIPGYTPTHKYLSWSVLATAMYCPLVYLPAAAGIRLATITGMPILAAMYSARLANCLVFLTALTIALRLAPTYRAVLAAVALMPMTLHQAAALSADQMTIALSLVVFALILRTRECRVSRGYLTMLLVLTVMLALCKNSYWAAPLLALAPSWQFATRMKRLGYITVAIVAIVGLATLWNHLVHPTAVAFRALGQSNGIDLQMNMRAVARTPFVVLRDISHPPDHNHLQRLVSQFVGVFGWSEVSLPPWMSVSYVIMLLVIATVGSGGPLLPLGSRVLLLTTFCGAALGIYVVLFVVDGIYAHGRYVFWSAGVQGRYFIPPALAGLIALHGKSAGTRWRYERAAVVGIGVLYCAVSLRRIVSFYYF